VLQGYFLPGFHKAYWLGLSATSAKGPFSWSDPSAALLPPSAPKAYSHWGAYLTASGGGGSCSCSYCWLHV
jgi:hypothetical protein